MADTAAMALRLSSRRDHRPDGPFALVSLHRTENIFRRRRLARIVELLEGIGDRRLLFILHPPTEARLRRYGLLERLAGSGIELRPRYSYLDFFALLKAADFVVSDGGSIQEESSYLGVPCLVLRKKTERPEGIGKNVVLSGYDPSTIRAFVDHFHRYRRPPCPGGESPTKAIVTRLREYA
jgi:UDP-N-acetylglucosamine 2-epimerase (non-hydrolysing)